MANKVRFAFTEVDPSLGALGAVWENQRLSLPLGGNLARFEARALVVKANVEEFPAVKLTGGNGA